MRALVIIPTFQEAENIGDVLGQVREAVPDAEVLVVDDGSPDGTADLADAFAEEHGGVSVMRRPGKAGLGSAYRDGFAWGLERGYQVLVEMDADLSHNPGSLPRLLAPTAEGADLVIGSRYVDGGAVPNWPAHRLLLSKWGNRYARFALGLPVNDATAGFRAYRATTLRAIDLGEVAADGYAFQIEMAYAVWRAGLEVVEVPIAFTDRVRGTSKMSWRIVAEAMFLVTWWGLRDRLLARRSRHA